MAGVTDRPFRQLCKRFGAGYAISEMVASNPRLRDTEKSLLRTDHRGEVAPIAVQIAGADPTQMAEAARYNVERGAQIIDINMGCPAKKVCNVAAGSALLGNETLVVAIPVIANGDIASPEHAKDVLDYTGADGVMIGRAAQGRPWIFREIRHFLDHGSRAPPPTVEEAHAAILVHLADHYAFYGESAGARIARKHLAWYTQDLAGAGAFRHEINTTETADAQLRAVNRFFQTLAGESERLDYRAPCAAIVDARAAFARAPQQSQRGGEALAA